MDRFKINFELKELEQVALWGQKPSQSIHWFGLTDGLLWIDVGEQTIYEYTKEAQSYFEEPNLKYVDYQISRFLEDFSFLFQYIGESIPKELYDNVEDFDNKLERWWDVHEKDPDELFDYFVDTDYVGLIEWLNFKHTMDSGHLTGCQYMSFFRCKDKIKIIWVSNYEMESGNSIWTSPNGMIEISYGEFVEGVQAFFQRFYMAMDKQVEDAVNKNWECVSLDKERLIIENKERKEEFNQAISFLTKPQTHTDWDNVMRLYEKMNSEIGELPASS